MALEIGYWNDPNAVKVFGLKHPRLPEDNSNIQEVIKKRIKKLKRAYQLSGGWRDIIDDRDSCNLYSEHGKWLLRWKCRYLVKALELALCHMDDIVNWNWKKCCNEAINIINKEEGWKHIVDHKVISNFHRQFRDNDEMVINRHKSNISS